MREEKGMKEDKIHQTQDETQGETQDRIQDQTQDREQKASKGIQGQDGQKSSPKSPSTMKGLDRDFKRMTYSRMIFSGVGNLVLLLICLWIHWSLGAIFLVFWLFVLPYLDMRRIRKYEAENPPNLPKSSDFDDTPFNSSGEQPGADDEEEDEKWKSWDDWDEWKKPKKE